MRLLNPREIRNERENKNSFLREESEILKEDVESSIKLLNRNREEAGRIIGEANELYREKMKEVEEGKKELENYKKKLIGLAKERKVKIGELDSEIIFSDLLTGSQKTLLKKLKEAKERLAEVEKKEQEAKELIGKASIKYFQIIRSKELVELKLNFLIGREKDMREEEKKFREKSEESGKLLENERTLLGRDKTELMAIRNGLKTKEEELEKREKLLESRNQTLKLAYEEAKLKGII